MNGFIRGLEHTAEKKLIAIKKIHENIITISLQLMLNIYIFLRILFPPIISKCVYRST